MILAWFAPVMKGTCSRFCLFLSFELQYVSLFPGDRMEVMLRITWVALIIGFCPKSTEFYLEGDSVLPLPL